LRVLRVRGLCATLGGCWDKSFRWVSYLREEARIWETRLEGRCKFFCRRGNNKRLWHDSTWNADFITLQGNTRVETTRYPKKYVSILLLVLSQSWPELASGSFGCVARKLTIFLPAGCALVPVGDGYEQALSTCHCPARTLV